MTFDSTEVRVNASRFSLRPLVIAVLAGCGALAGGAAHATDEDTPLSLTLAQSLTHDSNFAKDDASKSGETISSTAALMSLNKAYGRQTYVGSARLSENRYMRNSWLNNSGKDLSGTFSSDLLANWSVSVNGAFSENLNPIQSNTNEGFRLVKNIRHFHDGGATLTYGNGGRWAILGNYDANRDSYSEEAYRYLSSIQHTVGLKGIYYTSDLLNFGFGTRVVRTYYPIDRDDLRITDHNLDLSTNWQVTGLSSLNATITRRSSEYNIEANGTKGWTGSLGWNYTPHGLLDYSLYFSRTTGTDRSAQLNVDRAALTIDRYLVSNNTVTTQLNANATFHATGKVSFTASYNITHYKIDNRSVFEHDPGSLAQGVAASYGHSTSLTATYAAMRSLNLDCTVTKYSQGYDGYRLQYSGNSIACDANFTLSDLF